jgi:hypothetical protein
MSAVSSGRDARPAPCRVYFKAQIRTARDQFGSWDGRTSGGLPIGDAEEVLENLLLRHQLAVLTRPTRARPRPRLRAWDKLLWVVARRCCAGWREHLRIVSLDTVVRWHRQGWRRFWRWRSRGPLGRPRLSAEVRELIRHHGAGQSPLG